MQSILLCGDTLHSQHSDQPTPDQSRLPWLVSWPMVGLVMIRRSASSSRDYLSGPLLSSVSLQSPHSQHQHAGAKIKVFIMKLSFQLLLLLLFSNYHRQDIFQHLEICLFPTYDINIVQFIKSLHHCQYWAECYSRTYETSCYPPLLWCLDVSSSSPVLLAVSVPGLGVKTLQTAPTKL